MKKKYFIISIWILFYIFVFLFLLKNSYNYLDADLGWHLEVGKQILQEKNVPHENYFNYTIKGERWVDHEWLTNAVMYWLYNHWGYLSLTLFFSLLMLLSLILLTIFVNKYFVNRKSSLCFIIPLQALGVVAMAPHLGVRVQEITLLNILLLLIIIYKYERLKNIKPLWWLLPLFYFWACMHGGFLIGLFILFFWVGVKSIELILKKKKRFTWINFSTNIGKRHIFLFLLFSGLSVAVTLLTPYKFELYSFLGAYTDTYQYTHIEEWLPSYYLPILYWQWLYLALVVAILLLLTFFSPRKPHWMKEAIQRGRAVYNKFLLAIKDALNNVIRVNIEFDPWHILLVILFIFLAFKSKRNFPLLFIISFPLVIYFFSRYLVIPKQTLIAKAPKLAIFLKSLIIICFLLVIYSQAMSIQLNKDPFNSHCYFYPCRATEFLKQNSQYKNLRVFNQYGWGGYLIWTWPEKELFIDGRLPQYKFAGHTMLEEYYEFFSEEKVEAKLNEYNIELVLIKDKYKPIKLNWFEKYFLLLNEEKINSQTNYLKEYLDSAPGWQLVYNDSVSNVYRKD